MDTGAACTRTPACVPGRAPPPGTGPAFFCETACPRTPLQLLSQPSQSPRTCAGRWGSPCGRMGSTAELAVPARSSSWRCYWCSCSRPASPSSSSPTLTRYNRAGARAAPSQRQAGGEGREPTPGTPARLWLQPQVLARPGLGGGNHRALEAQRVLSTQGARSSAACQLDGEVSTPCCCDDTHEVFPCFILWLCPKTVTFCSSGLALATGALWLPHPYLLLQHLPLCC